MQLKLVSLVLKQKDTPRKGFEGFSAMSSVNELRLRIPSKVGSSSLDVMLGT